MSEPIIYIEPERLEKWKRRYPIHWKPFLRMLEDHAIIQRGGADPEFRRKACYRTLDLFLSMYDLGCRTEKHRQKMRRQFREMLAAYPQTDEFYPHFRQRLNEHADWVKHGFDDPDPDEIEGECDA
jgi:hypothetical protein